MASERTVVPSPDKSWVTISYTVNMGNYESMRIEMGFSKTHGKKPPIKEIEKMYDELEKKLHQKVSSIKKSKKSKS